MYHHIMLVKQVSLILIFSILCNFSISGWAANPYRYTDRYVSQSPTTKNLSNKEHWLIDFELSPNNKEIYAIDGIKKLLTIVNVNTGTILKIIPLPITDHSDTVFNIVFSPDGKKAYFANMLNSIYIIDTVKQEIIGKVKNKPASRWVYAPTGLYMAPDGRHLYAIDGGAELRDKPPLVHVIDTQVDSVVATIKKKYVNEPGLGWLATRLAFSKKTSKLYFTDMVFGTVSILNTRSYTLEDEAIKYNQNMLSGIAINPENDKLYVLSWQGSLFVTHLLTGKIINETSIGKETIDLALAANGTKLYVTNRATDTVSLLDVNQQSKLIKKIAVGHQPQTLRISSDGSKLYVGNAGSNDISVIDVVTDKVVRVITIDN